MHSSISSDVSNENKMVGERLNFLVVLFLLGLFIPLEFYIGSVRLSVYRIALVAIFIPALVRFFSNEFGRWRLSDALVLVICLWSALSLTILHGFIDMIEPIGITFLETLGSYLVGRTFIRTPEAFRKMTMVLFGAACVLLPFAVYEAVTGSNIVNEIFDLVGNAYPDIAKDRRLGLDRVQGPFEHPILFGVVVGGPIGLTYFVLGYKKSALRRTSMTLLVGIAGGLALSSGPLTSQIAQLLIILWNGILKRFAARWKVLVGLCALIYVGVDILSTRNPFEVFIDYLSFDPVTAYNRINIWVYGTRSIFNHPWLGIGVGDWQRPWWMSSSVDMFWILPAMTYGVVVWIAYLLLFFSIFLGATLRKFGSEKMNWYRLGYLTTLSGFFMAGWTVHYWNASFSVFMFLLGAGVWMIEFQEGAENENSATSVRRRNLMSDYSRFPKRTG